MANREKVEFARMMAHESRRSTIDSLVEAARVSIQNASDENEAAFMFGMHLAATDQGTAAAVKFAVMAAMLAIEVVRLRDVSSPEPGR